MAEEQVTNPEQAPEGPPPAPKKQGRPAAPAWRWAVRIGLVLGMSVLGAQLVFKYYADEIFGTLLQEVVGRKSGGLYAIEYGRMGFNLVNRTLDIERLRLMPNRRDFYDSASQRWNTRGAVVEADIPALRIEGIDLRHIYLTRTLVLDRIVLREPQVYVYAQARSQADSLPEPAAATLLSKRLRYLRVKEVVVENAFLDAQFHHEGRTDRLRLQQVTAEAYNLVVDSATVWRAKRPFALEELHLTAGHNTLELPNSPYTLTFNRLELSTYGAVLAVEGLRLQCSEAGKQLVRRGQLRSVVELEVPRLQAQGFDFHSAYFLRELRLQRLLLEQPRIEVFRHRRSQGQPPASIYPKFSKVFSVGILGEVKLDRAQAGTHWLDDRGRSVRFGTRSISGSLTGLRLEEATHLQRAKFFYADHVELDIEQHEAPFPDHAHRMRVGAVHLSTRKKTLEARQIRVRPWAQPDRRLQADSSAAFYSLTLDLPLLLAQQVDIRQAYAEQAFDMDYLLLGRAEAELFRYSADSLQPAQPDTLPRIADLYPYVKGFAKRVRLGRLDLREASVSLKHRWQDEEQALRIDSLALRIDRWQIGPNLPKGRKALFNAEQVEAVAQGLHFMRPDSLYRLDIGHFSASQQDSSMVADSLFLVPQMAYFERMPASERPQMAVGVALGSLRIDSIDLRQAYYEGHIAVRRLHLQGPRLSLQALESERPPVLSDLAPAARTQALLARHLSSLRLGQATLDGGALLWLSPSGEPVAGAEGLALGISRIAIDSQTLAHPEVLFALDTFGFSGRQAWMRLPDSLHRVELADFGFSTQAEKAWAGGIWLDTAATQRMGHRLRAHWRGAEANGLDLKRLYYRQELLARRVWVRPGSSRLWLDARVPRPEGRVRLDSLLGKTLEAVSALALGEMLLDTLDMAVGDWGDTAVWHRGRWQLLASDWRMGPGARPDARRWLQADRWRLQGFDVSHLLPDSGYHLTADRVRIDTKEGLMEALELNVHPLRVRNEALAVDAYFPLLRLEGWDIRKWHDTGALEAGALLAQAPWMQYFLPYREGGPRQGFRWQDLGGAVRQAMPGLRLGRLDLRQASVGAHWRLRPDSLAYTEVRHLDWQMAGVWIDTLLAARQRLFFSDTLNVRVADYALDLPDSLHGIRFDTLEFNSATACLRLKGFLYRPKDGPEAYGAKLGFEEDWASVYLKDAKLEGLNIRRFLDHGDFSASRLEIDGLEAELYRDKRLPDAPPRYHLLPRQQLRRLGFGFTLDSTVLQQGHLRYWEHPEEGEAPGFLEVGDVQARIGHVTNDSLLVAKWKSASIRLNLQLMGTGRLHAVFDLPLQSENGEYYYEGIADSMYLPSLNPLLEPVASLRIRSGYAKRIRFKVVGNDDYATGLMRFYYRDLKVGVINRKKNSDEGLISFIANTFVVNKNNPHHLIFMRKGKMFYRRDTEKSLVHYWTSTLLSGVKTSIGLNQGEKPDRRIRKTLLESVIENFKLEGRAERRQQRARQQELKEALRRQRSRQ